MEARLVPLNALLGLVTLGDVNSPVLAQAGFRAVGLEVPAVGGAGKVVIDVLLFHEATNHLVQCESKSGANVEEAQAKAYAAMTAQSAVQAACVTLKQRTPPTLETLYVCLADNADRIMLGLQAAEVSFAVLAVGERRLDLHNAEHANDLLRSALAGGISLAAPPSRIIPFDPESPAAEVDRHVLAALVAMLANRASQVSLTGLTERVAPHYGIYAHKAQNRLKSLIESSVNNIIKSGQDRFAYEPRTGMRPEGLVRFLKTPEDFDRRGRTQAYQALGRPGRPARRAPETIPGQLDLLRELDATDNDEEDSSPASEEEGQS